MALVLMVIVTSCGEHERDESPGGREMPKRAKLPSHIPGNKDMNGTEGLLGDFAFDVHFIDLPSNGTNQPFAFISLPGNSYDSLAYNYIEKCSPVQGIILRTVAKEHTGMVLDFRTAGTNSEQATFKIEAGDNQIPLVLVWDDASIDRAQAMRALLEKTLEEKLQEAAFLDETAISIMPTMHFSSRPTLEAAKTRSCFQ
ncbi:hypothetical protein LX64_01508 [Chitinophaga skermanii]|uniref:Uncharacterized protein n=2 Tax=Chitinophaga skermanii TaxID=331697 RepID=A0A327QYR8_9BACT|nr:hypothetical protein LX64_01508 [Chitinophaga skermanii]